ncbi:unnamed protein product [Natator depressus]
MGQDWYLHLTESPPCSLTAGLGFAYPTEKYVGPASKSGRSQETCVRPQTYSQMPCMSETLQHGSTGTVLTRTCPLPLGGYMEKRMEPVTVLPSSCGWRRDDACPQCPHPLLPPVCPLPSLHPFLQLGPHTACRWLPGSKELVLGLRSQLKIQETQVLYPVCPWT